jgi:beta-glucosidase
MREVYEYGTAQVGRAEMDKMVFDSARRILKIMFNLGLFESAYTDPVYAKNNVGTRELNVTAYKTGHLRSIIMLKNANNLLPIRTIGTGGSRKPTAYVALNKFSNYNPWTGDSTEGIAPVIDIDVVQRHYNVPPVILEALAAERLLTEAEIQTAMSQSDFAILKLDALQGVQASEEPQNLTYGPYTAIWQRQQSIGFDWKHSDGTWVGKDETPNPVFGDYTTNRSRKGRTHPGTPATLEIIQQYSEFF